MLTQKRLREVLHYDPLTGLLTWLIDCGTAVAGRVAGHLDESDGYIKIGVDGKDYYAHRLAWLYEKGYFPEHQIDHEDRIRYHNCLDNLRVTSRQCNARNTGNRKNNTSGVKGVSWCKATGKWLAQIMVNQKNINLGSHKSKLEVVCHRLAAEQAEDWEGCDSSSPAYKYVIKNLTKRD